MHATSYTHAKPLLGPSITDFVCLFLPRIPGLDPEFSARRVSFFFLFFLSTLFNSFLFLRRTKEHDANPSSSLTTEMFSFSSSFFLLFLVFFVRGVRFGDASLPATPSIFFFFVFVPLFDEVTTDAVVVIVSSRLSLCVKNESG